MHETSTRSTLNPAADCARFDAQCGDYLERELSGAELAWMTAHQAHCATCDAMVRELEAIVAAAHALPGIPPARDLWSGIEARLDTAVVPIGSPSVRAPARAARSVSLRTFAIAATLLAAVTSGITWRLTSRANASTDAAGSGPSVQLVARDLTGNDIRADREESEADVVYEREIAALRRIVDDRVIELDSATVRELRRNLDIIDAAIGDSRKALARDPRSALLATQLDRALETKLALLRRVALL